MFKNRILTFIFSAILIFGFSSCENYFGDINEDPNNPTDVTLDVLLPSIEVQTALIYGGDLSRFLSVVTQHVEGVERQWASINDYSISTSNMNTAWRTNLYAGSLIDLNLLKEKAVAEDLGHYEGVANALLAYSWMMATDVWNDMPYQEAFQGTDNLQPAFDSQEFIYSQVFSLLDAATALFDKDGGGKVPGTDDIMFEGDIDKWKKFVQVTKARAYLHLALVDNSNYGKALTALQGGFESNDDDARFPWGDGETSAAPWYQFNRDREGDIEFNPDLRARMEALGDDPRLPLYDQTFSGHSVMIKAQPYPFASFTEQNFMRAECMMQTGGDAQAIHDAYIAGIQASMDYYEVDGAAYIASVNPGVGNVTLENIIMQKHIALWTEPEVFNDWRRTGIPVLTPNSGTTVPVRMPYSVQEILFNTNTPDINFFSDKVWWDKN